MANVLVGGAGGFIGGHLVADLVRDGYSVRAVDVKPFEEWYQVHPDAENLVGDLTERGTCYEVSRGVDEVFNLAADMGGMGFIENNKAACMLSVLTTTHLLMAARDLGVDRFFFSSSACVYAADKQTSPEVVALSEADAYPAMPEDGYGWEKLFSERMCRHFREDFGLTTRVARFHNVYGPFGTFDGGREKAPAAICRKVAEAKLSGRHEIEIWGDGEQTRSFMFIDDCVYGVRAIMGSEIIEPINLGSDELVTINQLVDIVEGIAGIEVERKYDLTAPQGVRGRNSDNTMIKAELGWEPGIRLETGLAETYKWIYDQLVDRFDARAVVVGVNPVEDYTPSLLAGLVRYRARVALVVLGFAMLGAVYAWTSWTPQAAMTAVVQVSNTSTGNNVDPDRTTNEVAAALSSPEVVDAAQTASGVLIDDVATSWAQGQSTIGVLVGAGSADDATAAAQALLPAYNQVREAQTAAELALKVAQIDNSLNSVNDAIARADANIAGAPTGSAAAAQAQSERDALVAQRTQLESEKSQAQVAAATPSATVTLASGPDPGPGRVSLLMRYVPAGIVVGLLACMAVIAVVERRRPWLPDPEMASRLLRAPLLGVGPGPNGVTAQHGADAVAPVLAMSILRAVGNAPLGIALLVSRGGREVGEGSAVIARGMTPVLERAGAKVAVLAVTASGRALLLSDGVEEEIDGLWSEFTGREVFEAKLHENGIVADLVVLVPVADIGHEVLLDLVLLADVTVVATRTGSVLEPLIALRRDFDALGRDPHGVIADLSLR